MGDFSTTGAYAMYERFSDRSCQVMQLANQEAQRLNHEYIGTEPILLGLVKEGVGLAATVLKSFGAELAQVRAAAEQVLGHRPASDQIVMGRLPHTPEA